MIRSRYTTVIIFNYLKENGGRIFRIFDQQIYLCHVNRMITTIKLLVNYLFKFFETAILNIIRVCFGNYPIHSSKLSRHSLIFYCQSFSSVILRSHTLFVVFQKTEQHKPTEQTTNEQTNKHPTATKTQNVRVKRRNTKDLFYIICNKKERNETKHKRYM